MIRRLLLWPLLACTGLVVLLAGLRGLVWATGTAWTAPGIEAPQVFIWDHDAPAFGGLSGLLVAPDGTSLIAASDRGAYFTGRIAREQGLIQAIEDMRTLPVLTHEGKPARRFLGDLEALARLPDERIGLGFESYTRVQVTRGVTQVPIPTHPWDRFEDYFSNHGFEALAVLPGSRDRLLAILDRPAEDGAAMGFVSPPLTDTRQGDWTGPYPVPATTGYAVSGAELGPDGCLYVVERRYGLLSGFHFRVRRLWQEGGGWDAERAWGSKTLYRSAPASLGNAEGLALWTGQDGTLRITLVTDDGFWPGVPTRLIEIRLGDRPDCT